jgi:hypothetical protein
MCRWLGLIFATAVMGTVFAGCGDSTSSASHTTAAKATNPQPTNPTTTVAQTTLPITTMAAACMTDWSGGPVASQLDPLLLTLTDLPNGYTTTGPETVNSSPPEFDGVVPMSVPIAYITFTMGNTTTGPSSGIVEALDQTTSPQTAAGLLTQVNTVVSECRNGAGQTVDLPGPVPNLVATIFNSGSSIQALVTATVFTSKGPFLLEVRWFSQELISGTRPNPVLPPLPTPAVMGAVMDAALAHIPV